MARVARWVALVAVTGLLGLALLGFLRDGPLRGLIGPDRPARSTDAVRLGPEPGQSVSAYLAGLPARLPPPGGPEVPALVQFAESLDAPSVSRLVAGARLASAVFRVPLPRVQTALRFQPLSPVDLPDPAAAEARRLALGQAAAAREAESAARRLTGRSAEVARYEAGALDASAPCRCVLAVLVVGDRTALETVAARPGVRAVDAAPADTPVTAVALAPLLPEQTNTAAPVPDDGPVPGG
ncbi:hypothetical protein GCM10023321_61820 [Pseudonocardia eucalypti]|uniref:Uncharacterized protein n=1 Tax=Pseudonocardia eucalypti TaxID=648755 RepID=A0ABP9QWD4_9PSEU